MVADISAVPLARPRLHRHFATRARATEPAKWLAQAWAWAALVTPAAPEEEVLALLYREWEAFRARHPEEPAVAFRAPEAVPDEPVVPGPPPYDDLPPLLHGRYGIDLPTHEERVREEQERLARRDQAHYGF
jgi:hypothetical protein